MNTGEQQQQKKKNLNHVERDKRRKSFGRQGLQLQWATQICPNSSAWSMLSLERVYPRAWRAAEGRFNVFISWQGMTQNEVPNFQLTGDWNKELMHTGICFPICCLVVPGFPLPCDNLNVTLFRMFYTSNSAFQYCNTEKSLLNAKCSQKVRVILPHFIMLEHQWEKGEDECSHIMMSYIEVVSPVFQETAQLCCLG